MSLNPKRTIAELKELRELTADDNGAQRVAWTDTWLKAREWFQSKIQSLPVEHHYDAAGNSWTTLAGASEKDADPRRPSGFGSERWLAGWEPGRHRQSRGAASISRTNSEASRR